MTTTESPDREDAVAAVMDALGMTLETSRQTRRDPTRDGIITGHEITFRDESGGLHERTLFLQSGTVDADGVLELAAADGQRVSAWLYPSDPALPALPAVTWPEAASVVLERLGIGSDGLRLALLAYRPGKRAVIRMSTDSATTFVKVTRPEVAGPLRERHEAWRAAGLPVPRALSWAPEGLLALTPLPGVEASSVIAELDERFLDALDGLIERYSTLRADAPARRSLGTRAAWYAERAADLDPALTADLSALADRITALQSRAGDNPRRATIHGDLHLGQVFVDPADHTAIVGLLDIDTAGAGDPADDAAALWAHLVVTALTNEAGFPDASASARRLADATSRRWSRDGDPGFADRARAISAVHLLGHCISGTIDASTALAQANSLLDERPLIPTS